MPLSDRIRTSRGPHAFATRLFRLASKDARELLSSRATMLLLLVLGPLVGHAFITAVRTYADVSGSAGGAAALAEGVSPLDGILVPLFGAYALVSSLLLPFVAIRLVSAEKESGALGLLLQGRTSLPWMMLVKTIVIIVAWIVTFAPGIIALALWRSYGGHLHAAEVLVVLLGHMLRGLLIVSIAFAAAAVTDGAASAAVVTLGVTVGTWALDFVAQVQGGIAQRLARFTPESALRVFEQGELSASVVMVSLSIAATLLACGTIWLHPGRPLRRRVLRGTIACTVGVATIAASASIRTSWDVSEDRRNSFAEADEQALRTITSPITVTANLAAEDPRFFDLQRGVLHKLERLIDVHVVTTARTGTGLFEKPAEGYGEVWYAWRGKRVMSRSTTTPIVLETLYELTCIAPPARPESGGYAGYPLVAEPKFAALFFYLLWPLSIVLVAAGWNRGRGRASRS